MKTARGRWTSKRALPKGAIDSGQKTTDRTTGVLSSPMSIFLVVVFLGAMAYALILYSFFPWAPSAFKLVTNPALNDYATAVAGLLGTAATVIGVAFLIHAYNHQKQQAANESSNKKHAYKHQKQQAANEAFNKLYQNLLDDIGSIQYRKKYRKTLTSPSDSELFEGVDALFQYEASDHDTPSSVLNHLNLILVSFDYLVGLLETGSDRPEPTEILLHKIHLLYLAKIYWPCYKISYFYRHYLIRKNWGYPRTLFYYLDKMTAKSYLFFIANRYIIPEPPNKNTAEHPASGEFDFLGAELRSILTCDYTTLETYWNQPPLITDKHHNPNSTVNRSLTNILGDTKFSDAVREKVNQGTILKLRDTFYWFRTAFTTPNRTTNSEH